jgi:hypothetical protein
MHHVFFDIETRSAVSLRECGAHIYAIDPTTQPLCLAYAIDDGEPQLWLFCGCVIFHHEESPTSA